MKEVYILKASSKAFIKEITSEEIIITSDYKKAQTFDTFGSAMEIASILNGDIFESNLFIVVPDYI